MKIALISSFYFPITGGPSSDTFNLAKTLIELNHDVTVFTPILSQSLQEYNQGIEVVRLASTDSLRQKVAYFSRHLTPSGLIKAKIWNGFYSKLSKFLTREDFDVFHSRGIWCHALETDSAKHAIRVMTFGTMPKRAHTPAEYIWDRLLSLSLSEVDYRVAVWESLREPLWKLQRIRINKVIENGVDTNFFYSRQRKDESCFNIGAALKFAYKGKVDGLKILIQAFSKLSNHYKNIRLRIAGDGRLRNEVEETIRKLNPTAKQSITLLGELSYFDMPSFYNSLDLYAHISLHDSGPNTLLEAMSCGLPVIASDVGIVPRLVNEGTGWIVPPKTNDVYQRLATIVNLDKRTLRDKGGKARNKVQIKFSWKKTALEYLRLYGGEL